MIRWSPFAADQPDLAAWGCERLALRSACADAGFNAHAARGHPQSGIRYQTRRRAVKGATRAHHP